MLYKQLRTCLILITLSDKFNKNKTSSLSVQFQQYVFAQVRMLVIQ